ncbi:MAG: Asp-tRNA(Asn)/Glu-tRNA(Gln) amidotransferase subunit GatB [Candidatus Paceibacterota bacterium]|jgi:aspartyl-tRNA(Asn)/glutamyl-tRNA(Gln) amidotransferase subunit B
MTYKPTIGLEIHTELKTAQKMFCGCSNDPEEKRPNINVCPICLAHPGALPTINKEAVEKVIQVGLALGSNSPAGESKFDRKNYFYPDLPKGYQISQFDAPLCVGGNLNNIRITRIHLEEDTARLLHSNKDDSSLVDFNRAGMPLMELVTEPDIKSAEEALSFVKELQLILKYLGVSDADMEKGQMRCEVNISLSKNDKLGTKVEIKNLNSFRAVGESIKYEIERQTEALEKGEKIVQETMGWDDIKKKTISQRTKEESHDYRYFPEPDLPPLDLTKLDLENLKRDLPELPVQKRERFIKEYGLTSQQVELLVIDRFAGKFFEEAVSELQTTNDKLLTNLYNYLTSDLFGLISQTKIGYKDLKITPENFAELMNMIDKKEVSTRTAKDVLKIMLDTGRDPLEIIESEGLKQISDESGIIEVVKKVISENPKPVEDYKKGKENAIQALIGKAMGQLKGRANPESLKKLIKENLR